VPGLPDVPSLAELGFPGFDADIWFGANVPAKTPQAAIDQLAGWLSAAIKDSEVAAKLAPQGVFPAGACGKAYGDFLRKQSDDYGRAIQEANIKAN
jgi:tripartite-type tricarboxylate transporter receptor subunit TctC